MSVTATPLVLAFFEGHSLEESVKNSNSQVMVMNTEICISNQLHIFINLTNFKIVRCD